MRPCTRRLVKENKYIKSNVDLKCMISLHPAEWSIRKDFLENSRGSAQRACRYLRVNYVRRYVASRACDKYARCLVQDVVNMRIAEMSVASDGSLKVLISPI